VDISVTDRVQNEGVLHRAKAERKIPRTIKRTKAKWIGHTLSTNCLLKHTEGKTERTGRIGRRRNWLLDDLKEKKGYCKLKENTLYRTLHSTRFGRGYGPARRQTT
jgi:hypothetical protein